MPLTAFALALGAAVLHATWNVLLAGARHSEAATAVATLVGVVLLAPVAFATGGVSDAPLPFAAASAALHVAYLALLARAYAGGEVSVVYPVSRGTAPVLVLIFGAIVLGEDATAVQAAGVAAVSAGVFLVAGRRPAGHARLARRDLLFGIGIALTIAAYTLVDAEGVDHARAPAYLFLLLAPSAVIYAAALVLGGHASQMRHELRPQAFLIGACIVGAYGLVLAALRLASAAPVAAVRESSVVIATLLAAAFLHERVDGRRLGGALLVAAGVAAVALG
ncbi:MAG: EamA family transporter [Thermoleophilaceae bacterium]